MLTMRRKRIKVGVMGTALLAALLTTLAFTGSASAKLVGEFERFQFCPFQNLEVRRCTHAVTEGGEVVLGSKKSPIVNPVTLQGGLGPADEEEFQPFFAATNGETLEKVPQPVPGGLLGLVPPENSPPLVAALVELAAENGLTGVNAILELARPAKEIKISESHIAEAFGLGLKLPVKIRLDNPLLGSNCYIGSEKAPLWWELTSEAPNGAPGEVEFLEEGRILKLSNNVIWDDSWEAPAAKGCGGILLSALIDPVINAASGLPDKENTAILENTIHNATTLALRKVDSENP